MTITRKDQKKIQFSLITTGDCFMYDDLIFMRTSSVEERYTEYNYNAVCLSTGELNCFGVEDWVVYLPDVVLTY